MNQMTKKISTTTCLPMGIREKLDKLKKAGKIKSVSGEIRRLVNEKYEKITVVEKGQKTIIDYNGN